MDRLGQVLVKSKDSSGYTTQLTNCKTVGQKSLAIAVMCTHSSSSRIQSLSTRMGNNDDYGVFLNKKQTDRILHMGNCDRDNQQHYDGIRDND